MPESSVRTFYRLAANGDEPCHVITLSWDHAASNGRPVPVLENGRALDAFSLLFHLPTDPDADAAAIAEFQAFGYRFAQ